MDGQTWRLQHRPALDGLRAVAVALVLLAHAHAPGFGTGGIIGVTVFFTLSGYLITALLLHERADTGRIRVIAFYQRRARRLLPALLVNVVGVAAAALFIGSWFFPWQAGLATVGYYANWFQAGGSSLGGLGGAWSLSVEEQFYLVWPLVLLFGLRKSARWAAAVAGVGAVGAVLWRGHLWASGVTFDRGYYGTDMHADALLIGCFLAVVMTLRRESRVRPLVVAASAVGLAPAVMIPWEAQYTWLQCVVVPTVAASLTAVLIWAATAGPGSTGWLEWKPLRWLGRRAYGIYLWGCPVSVWLTHSGTPWSWPVRTAFMGGLAVVLAALSWRYVEKPWMGRPTPVGCGEVGLASLEKAPAQRPARPSVPVRHG